jgi:hypothetical protein
MPKKEVTTESHKTVAKTWTFQSDSNTRVTYETLQYASGETSCNCPGWTRKVDAHGHRSCKHTRLVHQNLADKLSLAKIDYTESDPSLKRVLEESIKVMDSLGKGKRRLSI